MEEAIIKKFVNHIDHVAWISRFENLEANVAELEKLSGEHLQRFERKDMGFVLALSWESGLEIMAPLPERTDFNQALHDHLEARGEGIFAVVFGVRDLDQHAARLRALGVELGPLVDDHPDSPWHHKLDLRERIAGPFLGSAFVLGDIDYADSVIPFGAA